MNRINRGNAAAAAGAIVLAALTIGWWLNRPTRSQPSSVGPTVAAMLRPAAAASSPNAVLRPAAGDSVRHDPDANPVCGGASVQVGANGERADPAQLAELERMADVARAELVAALRSDRSARAHAAADLTEAAARLIEANEAAVAAFRARCESGDCGSPPLLATGSPELADGLAQLASTTTDPQVYAWAVNACGAAVGSGAGHCGLLSVSQWALLDPDNARPWMAILAAALSQRDAAAADEALYRIARAKRYDVGWNVLPAIILAHASDADDRLVGTMKVLVDVIGIQGAGSSGGIQSLMSSCSGAAVKDANRSQLCAGAADVLAEHSDTLLARSVGVAVGQRSGWPDDRVDRMRGEMRAYTAHAAATGLERLAPLVPEAAASGALASALSTAGPSCVEFRRYLASLRAEFATTETDALREWLIRSPLAASDHLAAGRKIREERTAAGAAATAAAAARAAASAAQAASTATE